MTSPYARVLALVLLSGLLVGAAVGGRVAWVWQANDYGTQLANQATAAATTAAAAHQAARQAVEQMQSERTALQAQLQAQSATHFKEMRDAQQNRQRLADRLATADLRLSVLNANPGTGASGGALQPATAAGSLVHAAARTELDPAHAQRIVAITGDGDDGLRELAGCQAYARGLQQ